jgi:hypothetical protein
MFIPTTTLTESAASGAVLFDSTLGAPTASIDTGNDGIAGGYRVLEAYMVLRTSVAAIQSSCAVTVNNDTGANYDRNRMGIQNTGAVNAANATAANWAFFCHGDSGLAAYATLLRITIPFYTDTTWNKVGVASETILDNAVAAFQINHNAIGWRSTASITRMAVTAASGNLMTDSRMLILGF